MTRTRKYLTVGLTAILVAVAPTRAQEPNEKATELNEVIVTATRSAQTNYDTMNAVTTITQAEIERRASFGLIDALFDEAGVYTQRTTNGQGSPMIRNFTGYHTLLLVDGVRLNNWTFRSGPNQYFNTLSVDDAARVEVVRGPSAALYGSSALGGVINTISPRPDFSTKEFELRPRLYARYGSASQDAAVGLSLEGGGQDLAFRANITRKDVGDVRPGAGRDVHVEGRKFIITSEDDEANIPTQFRTKAGTVNRSVMYDVEAPTNYDEISASGSLSYLLDDRQSVRLTYQGVDQEVSSRWDRIASGETHDQLTFDPQRRHLLYANYGVDDPVSGVENLSATVSFQRQVEGQTQLRAGADPNTETTKTKDAVDTIGLSLLAHSSVGEKNTLTYGIDAYSDAVSSEQTSPGPRAWGRYPDGSTAFDVNLHAQDRIELTKRATAAAGVTGTLYHIESDLSLADPTFGVLKKDGAAITGSVSLGYEAADGVKLFGAAGTGFRAPTIDDLTGVQATNQGVQAPSPDVDPERTLSIEAGVKLNRPRVGGSATVFQTRLTNQMVARPVADVYGPNAPTFLQNIAAQHKGLDITVLDNLDESVVRGIEADAYLSPTNDVTIYGVGSILRGEVLKLDGAEPDPTKPWDARIRRETPPHATLGVRWEPETEPYWAEFFARGAVKQDRLSNGDIRDARIPGFTRDASDVRFDADGRAIDAGTPGWFTLNLRGGVTILDASRLTLAVENILDRRYRWHGSGVDAPGRNVIVSLDNRF